MEFELPSQLFLFLAVALAIGALNYLKTKKHRNLLIPSTAVFVAFGVVSVYSVLKLNKINSLVANGHVETLIGEVTSYSKYNGKESFYVNEEKFEVEYTEIYCFSEKGVFSDGKKVKLIFIDLAGWDGTLHGNCILSYELL